MPNPIPGANVLGCGFDVLGRYDASGCLYPMFDLRWDASRQWDYHGTSYLWPDNTRLEPTSKHYGGHLAVNSREEVLQYFAGKVKLDAKGQRFSGEFQADYSQVTKSDVEYQFALVEANSRFWSLDLNDRSSAQLANWVTTDPLYAGLPGTFSDQTKAAFFRFFDKYGTHFVVGVDVGARLYYTSTVLKTHGYSETEINAKMRLEFKAVFLDTSAQAQVDWRSVGETWAGRREVSIMTQGGSNGILAALLPVFDSAFNTEYLEWLDSGPTYPAVIELRLAGMDSLFGGSQATAVAQAIEAYSRTRLYLEATSESCAMVYNGALVMPRGGGKTWGFQMAAFDRRTLALEWSRAFSAPIGSPLDYEAAMGAVAPYNSPNYVIAFVTWQMFGTQYPAKHPQFLAFLVSCGAGAGLEAWHNLWDLPHQNPNWKSCDAAQCNYVLAGVPGHGRGSGVELFKRAPSCDTGDWEHRKPAAMASVQVDLFKLADAPGASEGPALRQVVTDLAAKETIGAG